MLFSVYGATTKQSLIYEDDYTSSSSKTATSAGHMSIPIMTHLSLGNNSSSITVSSTVKTVQNIYLIYLPFHYRSW